VALWQALNQPRRLLGAMITWSRSIQVADAELAQASAALEAQAAAIPDLTPRERLGVLGALGRAASMRGDHPAVLPLREAEAAAARQLGDQDSLDAAESNIVAELAILGRHEEAAALGAALLTRVDADGSGSNGNLPWVLGNLFDTLMSLHRLDDARALLPRLIAAGRRFATPTLAMHFCTLAAAEQRHVAAAQLIGYMRQCYDVRGMPLEVTEEGDIADILANVTAAIGPERTEALLQQGRRLDDGAAEALAAATRP
jgi:hypothetical protein